MKAPAWVGGWAAGLALLTGTPSLYAQPAAEARGAFQVPFFTEGRQTALLTGRGATMRPDGTVLLETARFEHLDLAGNTNANVIVMASNCEADLRQNVVRSPGSLRVLGAAQQFEVTGTGFAWWQTNNQLVVSNAVDAAVRRGATGAVLRIRSDIMRFHQLSNLVEFVDGVRAEDPDLEVRCGLLLARRSATGKFDRLLAEREVSITSRRDGSRAQCGRAEYRLSDTGEWIELTGQPFWTDGVREARAGKFVLERGGEGAAQRLQAFDHAWLKAPTGTNSLGVWTAAPTDPSSPATNRFFELSCEALTLWLPPTNGPVLGLLARTNVLVHDSGRGWEATANQAAFTNQVVELNGDARWRSGAREVRAETLRLDQARPALAATGRAWVSIPAVDFGGTFPALTSAPTNSLALGTNHFIVVTADHAEFADDVLRFAPPVHAELRAAEQLVGTMDCRDLKVGYRNSLESIEAGGGVRFHQLPKPGTNVITRTLESETIGAVFDTKGQLRRVTAAGGVRGEQTEQRATAPTNRTTRIAMDALQADFSGMTNRLERAVAEGRVRLERNEGVATGGRAVFTGTNGWLTVTDEPRVITPQGELTGAEALIWDSRTGRWRGHGPFRVRWSQVPTNIVLPGSPAAR